MVRLDGYLSEIFTLVGAVILIKWPLQGIGLTIAGLTMLQSQIHYEKQDKLEERRKKL